MTKKEEIGNELETIALFQEPPKKMGRPQSPNIYHGSDPARKGLQHGWVRTTIVLDEETFERLNDYCYTMRVQKKETVNQVIKDFLDAEEAAGVEFLVKPKKE